MTDADAVPPATDARSRLRSLVAQKDSLEIQLEALASQAHSGQKLVDDEGFPRADLDVHAIRNARAEMAKLQTDHQRLMKDIETAMFAMHAEAKAAKLAANPSAAQSAPLVRSSVPPPEPNLSIEDQIRADAARAEARSGAAEPAAAAAAAPTSAPAAAPAQPQRQLEPFYRVASVSPDSPAEVAGLKAGDLVLQFGSISKANYSAASMSSVVASSIGRAIPVTVDRNGARKELRLIPQSWGGRGMLGCHLVDV